MKEPPGLVAEHARPAGCSQQVLVPVPGQRDVFGGGISRPAW
jgi:hypothetical protein